MGKVAPIVLSYARQSRSQVRSFPRKRESRPTIARFQRSAKWIPAFVLRLRSRPWACRRAGEESAFGGRSLYGRIIMSPDIIAPKVASVSLPSQVPIRKNPGEPSCHKGRSAIV